MGLTEGNLLKNGGSATRLGDTYTIQRDVISMRRRL